MIPQELFDKTVLHQTHLLRRSNGIIRDVFVLLKDAENDIKTQIVTRDMTAYQTQRLQSLLVDVQKRISELTKTMSKTVKAELEGLSVYESGNQADMLRSTLGVDLPPIVVPPTATLVSSVVENPIQGKFFAEWMETFEASTVGRLNQAIRIGVLEGETESQLIRRVRNEIDTTRNAASQLVRTSTNSVTNNARQLLWAQNSDIIEEWQFVATLDSRTTFICIELDGERFPIGEGPKPPRHRSCRSTTIAVVKDSIFTPAMRASAGGPVDASLTYPAWLKTQPVSVQKDVLGVARQKMWSEGRIEIKNFTDDTGRTLTLDELKKKDSKLFDS